jgi:hypothetical protein
MARLAKVPVEVEVEFESPSPNAGRKMRLWYDPDTDREGHKFLDDS